jgi:regulatory protein
VALLKPTLGAEYNEGSGESKKNRALKNADNPQLTVTKIAQQVKRQDRYSVYINEKYSFSLSEYQLAGSGLRIGKIFTAEELSDFIGESEFGKAYERALNYVMIRPRSEKEIKEYLTRTFMYPKSKSYVDKEGVRHFIKKEVDKQNVAVMIERVLARLKEKGYINDQSFAAAWVNSRQLVKKSSKRKLEQELRAKGVDQEVIATLLQNNNDQEVNNLKELIAKKRRLTRYQDETKLIQYLLRQGFNYDDIKECI